MTTCTTCDGTGLIEVDCYHPDDPRRSPRYECDDCFGTGEVEPFCGWCERTGVAIDANGMCADCEADGALVPTTVTDLGDGKHRCAA